MKEERELENMKKHRNTAVVKTHTIAVDCGVR